jgi:uncharacterized membrane protein (DUF373 family)
MTDPFRPTGQAHRREPLLDGAPRLFGHVEHVVGIGIGVLLSVAAVLALAGAGNITWEAVVQWPQLSGLFRVVDRLLLVLMIIEILHTVRTSIQSHQLACEPFLIVGLIATIRRILVVTFEISDHAAGNEASGVTTVPFGHAMIELGVLAVLTLVLAIAIWLSRRARAPS